MDAEVLDFKKNPYLKLLQSNVLRDYINNKETVSEQSKIIQAIQSNIEK